MSTQQPLSAEGRELLALHLIDGLGPIRIAALMERFGTAARVRQASQEELVEVDGVGPKVAANIRRGCDVDAELALMHKGGVRLVVRGQQEYPPALALLTGAPLMLYLRGSVQENDTRAVALVGTRKPNAYGKTITQRLAEGLARVGVTVISGLARGIDGIAHRGALAGGGRTLAVLAGGLGRIYPPEHSGLAEEVMQHGALLTENAMRVEPLAGLFPARNRIISGLSRVIVIVQAPEDSGALITAKCAAEQGRTVMAVPGSVDDPEQKGCHGLLRQGAVLCTSVEDILEELDGVFGPVIRPAQTPPAATSMPATPAPVRVPPPAPVAKGPPAGLDALQKRVWEALGTRAMAVDEMAQQLGVSVSALGASLFTLEMRKVVKRLPGNRYERC